MRMRLEKQCNLPVNGFRNVWCRSIPKLSPVYKLHMYKVTYLNILCLFVCFFFLSDFNRFFKFFFSSLVQAEGTPPRFGFYFAWIFFGTFSLVVFFCFFFPPPNPPPPSSDHFSNGLFLNHLLIISIYSLSWRPFSYKVLAAFRLVWTTLSFDAVQYFCIGPS